MTRLTYEELIAFIGKLLPPETAITELFTIEANCGGVAIETQEWLERCNAIRLILEEEE